VSKTKPKLVSVFLKSGKREDKCHLIKLIPADQNYHLFFPLFERLKDMNFRLVFITVFHLKSLIEEKLKARNEASRQRLNFQYFDAKLRFALSPSLNNFSEI